MTELQAAVPSPIERALARERQALHDTRMCVYFMRKHIVRIETDYDEDDPDKVVAVREMCVCCGRDISKGGHAEDCDWVRLVKAADYPAHELRPIEARLSGG